MRERECERDRGGEGEEEERALFCGVILWKATLKTTLCVLSSQEKGLSRNWDVEVTGCLWLVC